MPSNFIRAWFLVLCLSQASPVFGQFIIGHRGASHDAPENTLAAFCLAWEQGADGVEGDFYLSSDGRIVCIHDRDTKRVATTNHVVAETTFSQLRSLDVGSWKDKKWRDERIPSIEEVLAVVPNGKKIFIEIKIGPEIVKPLKKAIEASDLRPEQIVIISFHADSIEACEKSMPQLRTHWLTGYKEQEDGSWKPTSGEVARKIEQIHADGLGSNAKTDWFNRDFVGALRTQGMDEFHVWTVNDAKVARQYQQLGAWSITTDRPGWLREQLGNLVPTNK